MARYRKYNDGMRLSLRVAPRTGVFASGTRDDYAPSLGRMRLNPAKLGRVLRAADEGDTRALFEVFDAIEEDPHVHATLGKRKRAVISRTLQIEPARTAGAASKPAERAAELCRAAIFGDEQSAGIQGWHRALMDVADAIGRGFSLHQIIWENAGGVWRPVRLHRWPQRECMIGAPGRSIDEDADAVRVLTDAQPVWGEDLEPSQWVLHAHKARSDSLARSSLLRIVAWWFLFKHFSARDWTVFGERYGMPLRVGKYPPGADDQERSALARAIFNLGKDAGAVLPEGSAIEFVESRVSGQLPYERLIRICDEQISKAILGSTLTTDAGERGARSLGEVHSDQTADIIEHDALSLAETLRVQLLTPIVRFNLGDRAPVPEVAFLEDENVDHKARAEVDEILTRSIGLPLAQDYFYRAYDRPRPEGSDALVAPPVAKRTSEEDLETLEEAEGIADLDDEQRAASRAIFASVGPRAAMQYVTALADVKKKSRAWAR